jgi:pimeloyl-ACP methyl ester carboxylesterase
LKFDFAIMVASFKSRSSAHCIYYEKPITCPTLHVYGDTDKVIPKGMCCPLYRCYATCFNLPCKYCALTLLFIGRLQTKLYQ